MTTETKNTIDDLLDTMPEETEIREFMDHFCLGVGALDIEVTFLHVTSKEDGANGISFMIGDEEVICSREGLHYVERDSLIAFEGEKQPPSIVAVMAICGVVYRSMEPV